MPKPVKWPARFLPALNHRCDDCDVLWHADVDPSPCPNCDQPRSRTIVTLPLSGQQRCWPDPDDATSQRPTSLHSPADERRFPGCDRDVPNRLQAT